MPGKSLSKGDLATLRRCLDLHDPKEINTALVTYSRTLELMMAEFPTSMTATEKKDWAIANALSPDWFGDDLTTRLQNNMLVSALLLTVTATSFMEPMNGGDYQNDGYRLACYTNGICSALFLMCIFFGICFIENAMSRAYCWSDRFCLIIKQYSIKNLCQYTATLGTILFPITLLAPMQFSYLDGDSTFMYVVYGAYSLGVIYVQIVTMNEAAEKQAIRTSRLDAITDPETGRLLAQFSPEEFEIEDETEVVKKVKKVKDDDEDDKPEKVFELMYSKN